MPRKATDLLDVFRSQRAQPTPSAPRPKEPKAEKRGFSGLVLLPRHVLLGSSVVVLLLVFAFVLGLSVGKRGDARGPGAADRALHRVQPRVEESERAIYVEARIPYLDPVRHAVNDPKALRDALVRSKGLPANRVWVTDEIALAQLRVLIGPFSTQTAAAELLRRAGLFTTRLGGVLPWQNPEYLWLAPNQLPAEHVPTTR